MACKTYVTSQMLKYFDFTKNTFRSITIRGDSPYEESIQVRRTFTHPKFDFPGLYYDIAVVELGNV